MVGGITQSGLNLQQQAIGTTQPLRFVSMHLGSGTPSTSDLGTITSLVADEVTIPIQRTSYFTPNYVQTTANLSLVDINADFVYHELGVYASVGNNTPQLYAYFYQMEGERISKLDLVERTLAIDVFVDKAVNLDVTIDNSVVWVNKREFFSHTDDITNPHNVTKQQVGLGSLENLPLTTLNDVQRGEVKHTYLTHDIADAFVTQKLTEHTQEENPHNITKSTLGLGNVQNYSVASQEEVQSNIVPNNKYTTPHLVDLQTLNKILTGAYLLSSFTDYTDLLRKDGLTVGPNLSLIETEDGLKLTYIGSTQIGTISWQDIISGNFAQHPDVMSTLSNYLKSITSTDRSITVTKDGNKIDLSVNFKAPTFKEIEGNPVTNQLLANLLNAKLSQTQIFNSDDIIKEQLSDGNICFKLRNTNKAITWADLTGQPSSNVTLTEYIKSLIPKVEEQKIDISTYIKAGNNVTITKNSDNTITINSTATSTGTGGGTGGTTTTTVSFVDIKGSPTDNVALSQLLEQYMTINEGLQLNAYIGEINTKLGEEPLKTTSQTITGAVNECFQSVSDGKSKVALAITEKGVTTNATDTFTTMASNIASIQTGAELPQWDLKFYKHFVKDTTNLSGYGTLETGYANGNNYAPYAISTFHKHLDYNSYECNVFETEYSTEDFKQSHLGFLLFRLYGDKSTWYIHNLVDKSTKSFVDMNYAFYSITPNGLYAVGTTNNSAVVKLNLKTGDVSSIAMGYVNFPYVDDTCTYFASDRYLYAIEKSGLISINLPNGYTPLGFVGKYLYVSYSSSYTGTGKGEVYQLTLSGSTYTEKKVATAYNAMLSHDTLFCVEYTEDGKYQLKSYDGATLEHLATGVVTTSYSMEVTGPNQVGAPMEGSYEYSIVDRKRSYVMILYGTTEFVSKTFANNGLFYVTMTHCLKGQIQNNVAVPLGFLDSNIVYSISPNGLHGIVRKSDGYLYYYDVANNTYGVKLTQASTDARIDNTGKIIATSNYLYKLNGETMESIGYYGPPLDRDVTRFVYGTKGYYYNGSTVEETYYVSTGSDFPYYLDTIRQKIYDISDIDEMKQIGFYPANATIIHDCFVTSTTTNPLHTFSKVLTPNVMSLTPTRFVPKSSTTTRISPTLSINGAYTITK